MWPNPHEMTDLVKNPYAHFTTEGLYVDKNSVQQTSVILLAWRKTTCVTVSSGSMIHFQYT